MDATLKLLFKQKRRAVGKPNRVKTRRNHSPKALQYPLSAERAYQQSLSTVLKGLTLYVRQQFEAQGEKVLRGDSTDPTVRMDALPGKLWSSILAQIKQAASVYVPEDASDKDGSPANTYRNSVLGKVTDAAEAVDAFNQIQWRKQTKQMLGFEFDTGAAWWPVVKDQWAKRNYDLVKSLTDQYIGRLNDLTEDAVVHGRSYSDVMKGIDALGQNLTETRTRLLARDQIGKLNGRVSQGRMADMGMDEYTWMTAADDRVRGDPNGKYPNADPSHYLMDGMVCKWSDPTVYSDDGGETWQPRTAQMPDVGPGEDIQCRCTGAPNWKPLLKQLDAEIDGPEALPVPDEEE